MTADAISTFAHHARIFVSWAEGAETAPRAADALRNIAELYACALSLPKLWCDELSQDALGEGVAPEMMRQVHERAAQLPLQGYWEIFDGSRNPPEEPVHGSLVDDVGDIYRDVARGLALFESGKRAEALWEWAFNFRIHWGEHALSAMRALHRYLSSEMFDGLSADVPTADSKQ
jgi:hypothetical protein